MFKDFNVEISHALGLSIGCLGFLFVYLLGALGMGLFSRFLSLHDHYCYIEKKLLGLLLTLSPAPLLKMLVRFKGFQWWWQGFKYGMTLMAPRNGLTSVFLACIPLIAPF